MKFSTLIQFTRPFTLLVPAVGIWVGAYLAVLSSNAARSDLIQAVLLLSLPAALLNAASNGLNQIFDAAIDAISKPQRPIPSGKLSLSGAWGVTTVLYITALTLFALAGTRALSTDRQDLSLSFFLVIGIATACTVAYSAPPLRFKRSPWLANITIAVPRGLLLPLAGWLAYAPISQLDGWLIGITPGLYLLGAASTKDFADAKADAQNGVRTIANVLPAKAAVRLMAPFLCLPFLLISLYGVLPHIWQALDGRVLVSLGLVLALWGAYVASLLLRKPDALATEANHPAWKHMYLIMLAYYGGIVLAASVG